MRRLPTAVGLFALLFSLTFVPSAGAQVAADSVLVELVQPRRWPVEDSAEVMVRVTAVAATIAIESATLHLSLGPAFGARPPEIRGNVVRPVLRQSESSEVEFMIPAAEAPGGLLDRELLTLDADSMVVQLELYREGRGIYPSRTRIHIVPVAPFRTVLLGGLAGVLLANVFIVLAVRVRKLEKANAIRDFVPEVLLGLVVVLVVAVSAYVRPPSFAPDLFERLIANDFVDGFWLGVGYDTFFGGLMAFVRRKTP